MKDFRVSSVPGRQGQVQQTFTSALPSTVVGLDRLHVISAQPLVSEQLLFAPPQAEMRQQLMK